MVSEGVFLLHSLIMGVFVTFVYDILRIIRRVIPHGSFCVSVEDFIFWVYCGAEVFLLMYHESNGTLRWFAVLGAVTGMLFYSKLVSPLLVKYVSLTLTKILGLLGKLLLGISRPFRRAFVRAGKGSRRIFRKQKKVIKNKLTFFLKELKMNIKV